MKYALILLILLIGCQAPVKERQEAIKSHVTIITIDGCEYLTYDSRIIHKANCKNHME